MFNKVLVTVYVSAFILAGFGISSATSTYYSRFTTTYPASATSSFSCQICHVPAGPPSRNPYGAAFKNAGFNFKAIEALDSDGDGSTNLAEITAGSNPGDAGSRPSAACASFTYSAWSACQSNNTQTRTVISSSPAGCTGGSPVLSQYCNYVPPVATCTSFTYSAWSACQSNNTQTRTVISGSPAGCAGGSPVLTQPCSFNPPRLVPPATSGLYWDDAGQSLIIGQ